MAALLTTLHSTYSAAVLVEYERTLAAQAPTPIAECSLGAGMHNACDIAGFGDSPIAGSTSFAVP